MVDRAAGLAALRPGRGRNEAAAVGVVVLASTVAGALSGVHPTGTSVIDPLYGAILAGCVAAGGALAGRVAVLWLAGVAAAFSRGYAIFPAFVALLLAFGSAATRKPLRSLSALSSAIALQVVLRLPHIGFQGGSAIVAAGAVGPCLVHAVSRLPRRARRTVVWTASVGLLLAVVLTIPVAVEILRSHTALARGTTEAQGALRSVSDGDASAGTAQLDAARADFAVVARRTGAWWAAGAELVPVVSQHRDAVVTGAQVARDVAAAAGAEAGQIDFARLHYQGGGLDLAQVAALREPLDRVDAVLTSGLVRLHASQSGWLVKPLESRLAKVTDKVSKAQHSASLADQAVTTAPSLLGGQGTRHYMVVLMDPSETRGLGGLIVWYGVVTASDGHLTLDQFQDISKFNSLVAEHGTPTIRGPADFLSRYGQNPATYAQNVTYSPDLPTVTDVMAQLYQQAGDGQLDGVIVLDPKSLASLLSFTGPVHAVGLGDLTAANAEQVLERGQYAAFPSPSQQTVRRNALTDAMKQALSKLTSGSLPGPLTLSQTLDPDVLSGDLLFWSTHPKDQALLDRIGMAGAFPRPNGGDLLGVVTSNAAANKIDAYLQRTINDQVSYDPSNGQISANIQVALNNEAPAKGLSQEVIGSYTASGLPPGTNRTWVSIYSPLQLSGAELDGHPVTTVALPELGVETYSIFINIAAGATETLTFHLQGRVAPGGYGLNLYSQPTALPDRTTITVTGKGGSQPDGPATWLPTGRSRAYRFFSFG